MLYTTLYIGWSSLRMEKEMAIHSSVLAWRIPGTGEPDGLPSMGSHRVRHDWSDLAAAAAAAALENASRLAATKYVSMIQISQCHCGRLQSTHYFLSHSIGPVPVGCVYSTALLSSGVVMWLAMANERWAEAMCVCYLTDLKGSLWPGIFSLSLFITQTCPKWGPFLTIP